MKKVRPKHYLAAFAVFLVIYFVALPLLLANQYVGSAEPKQNHLQEKISAAYDTFDSGAFSRNRLGEAAEIEDEAASEKAAKDAFAADYVDIEKAQKAIREAKAAIKDDGSVDSFITFPGMTLVDSYSQASDIGSLEKKYVQVTQGWIDDYAAVVVFVKKSTEVAEKLHSTVDALSFDSEDPNTIAAEIEKAAKEARSIGDEYKTLKVPPSLREIQRISSSDIDEAIPLMFELAAAIRNLDLGSLESLVARIEESSNTSDAKLARAISRLQRDSEIRKSINELKNLEKKINEAYGNF